jgi:hypothetical protein
MPWPKRRKRETTGSEHLVAQVGEFSIRTERTYLEEPDSGGRVVIQPGKMLDKLRERMERVVLKPLDIEVAVEDFLTFDKVFILVTSNFGGVLVGVTAKHAADLLAREFSPEEASQPNHLL